MDDRCYWIWLQSALGVQSRLEEAIAYFGTARRLYEAGELEWKLAGLFTARQLEKLRSQRLTQAEEILKQCAGNGWLALTPEDPCYPKRLRAIPNFPAALYVWGRMPDLDGRVALAVVGAREASFQGCRSRRVYAKRLPKRVQLSSAAGRWALIRRLIWARWRVAGRRLRFSAAGSVHVI